MTNSADLNEQTAGAKGTSLAEHLPAGTRPVVHVVLASAICAAVGLAAQPAAACGGLFCSASAPVNQTAERILFAQGDGVTTQIVEILYEGPSERFAWVLPVPGTPEVAVSSKQVFDRLQGQTNPQYVLNPILPQDCAIFAAGGTGGAPENDGNSAGPTVTVVDAGSVGPFDYETISVDAQDSDPADIAIRWLEANDYDVGALGPDVLRPYLENGLNLIAVRLQKGVDTGSIQPLALTFQGMQPAIPIRPTAVAANDDMGILVWILGEARAVPENYYGLELNEALIDWTNPGPTYNAVVTAAADEAGGQGFVTEFAGAAAPFAPSLRAGVEPLDSVELPPDDVEQRLVWLTSRYGDFDGFVRILGQHASFRDELTAADFATCPECYFHPDVYQGYTEVDFGASFDPETDPVLATDLPALFAAVDEAVLLPVRDAADLFDQHAYLTRFYTTMSASEMDVDPVFAFNPDLEDVSNIHTADRVFVECFGPDWTVTLPDGTEITSVDGQWPLSVEDPQGLPFNRRVVSFSTSGPGVVEVDNGVVINDAMEMMDNVEPPGTGGSAGENSSPTNSGGGAAAGEDNPTTGGAPAGPGTTNQEEDSDAQDGGFCSWKTPTRSPPGSALWLVGLAAAGAFWRRSRKPAAAPAWAVTAERD